MRTCGLFMSPGMRTQTILTILTMQAHLYVNARRKDNCLRVSRQRERCSVLGSKAQVTTSTSLDSGGDAGGLRRSRSPTLSPSQTRPVLRTITSSSAQADHVGHTAQNRKRLRQESVWWNDDAGCGINCGQSHALGCVCESTALKRDLFAVVD